MVSLLLLPQAPDLAEVSQGVEGVGISVRCCGADRAEALGPSLPGAAEQSGLSLPQWLLRPLPSAQPFPFFLSDLLTLHKMGFQKVLEIWGQEK